MSSSSFPFSLCFLFPGVPGYSGPLPFFRTIGTFAAAHGEGESSIGMAREPRAAGAKHTALVHGQS